MKENKLASHALLFVWISILCASTSPVFVRYSTCPALVLAAYRKTMVTLMLLPMALGKAEYRRELRSLDRRTVLWCVLSGCFLGIHFWTYFLATAYTTLAAAQVLGGLEVVYVAVVMFLLKKEVFTRQAAAGILIALAGGLLVAYIRGGFAAGGSTMFGNLCGLICGVMIAAYSLIGTKIRVHVSNTVYTFLVYGAAAVLLNIMVFFSPYSFTGYGKINYLMGFLQAVFGSLLGHSICNWALKYLSPTLVALCRIFLPVFVGVWALLLFSEVPTWNQLVGGAVVIIGIVLYIGQKDKKKELLLSK